MAEPLGFSPRRDRVQLIPVHERQCDRHWKEFVEYQVTRYRHSLTLGSLPPHEIASRVASLKNQYVIGRTSPMPSRIVFRCLDCEEA